MQSLCELATSAGALGAQLENYLRSHADDSCKLLGVPLGMPLCVEIVDAGAPIETRRDERGATLRIGADDAQRVMAYTRSCNWANGIVLVPTLTRLVLAGAFDGLKVGEPRAMRAFAATRKADPTRNLGLLWGALNLLGLAGWVTLGSGDEHADYALTPAGARVVECVNAQRPLFTRLADATAMLQHLHALCHRRRENADESARYAALVRICIDGWPLPAARDDLERHADAQLRTAMDGLLLGPTWVALDMPVFEKHGAQQGKVAASFFEVFDAHREGVAIGDAWPHADRVALDAAWALLCHAGVADSEAGGARVRLNETGRIHRPIAAPYAGLAASYLRSYALLDELLFGNPDPLDVDRDGHIDRVMNVYASSGAGSGPASKEITTKIIRRLFDETPLDQQPAGISDMGCGDGSALRRLAQYVIESTRRGRHLADHPLIVIGADYNESARSRAADTLAALSDVPGVHVRVIDADISRPDRYDEAVAASGLTVKGPDGGPRAARLSDLLHTFMFLVHNRRLGVRSGEAADAILERHLRQVDRAHLRGVVERYYPGQLTVSDDAALPVALDTIKRAFRVAYSDAEGLVPGYVAAADLIDFVARWKPHAKHGFLVVEGHSPWAASLLDDAVAEPGRWTRTEQLPSVFNWGMHFLSRQFMAPFDEFMLAMCIAGLSPRDAIHGRIHPEGFPGPDLLDAYRFFSIADYVAYDAAHA
ncbi:beta-ketoacyl synthase [Burkholderia pseudomallei]|nr:beta-ketoacyl synthase [Burkholderia pseudomallei]